MVNAFAEGAKRWRIFDTSSPAVPRWPVLDAGMSDRLVATPGELSCLLGLSFVLALDGFV